MIQQLSPAEIDAWLSQQSHPSGDGFKLSDGRLMFEIAGGSYDRIAQCVALALAITVRQDHHPEVAFSYSHLRISLFTHDCQGLSARDLRWASAFMTGLL